MRVCSCTSSCKTVITCIKSPDNVNCGPLCHVNSSRRLQAHELTAISCCYRYHKFLLQKNWKQFPTIVIQLTCQSWMSKTQTRSDSSNRTVWIKQQYRRLSIANCKNPAKTHVQQVHRCTSENRQKRRHFLLIISLHERSVIFLSHVRE